MSKGDATQGVCSNKTTSRLLRFYFVSVYLCVCVYVCPCVQVRASGAGVIGGWLLATLGT